MTTSSRQVKEIKTRGEQPKRARIEALEVGVGVMAGVSMQPFGLKEKATEKQNTQNHYDCDYDDLDQAHY
ncbi:MAG: hypothetical protein H7Z16_08140 [Pyrinomonadaceae bacterium]|nr:hypothetical protein [Pyrinomonadaceae bacterium]